MSDNQQPREIILASWGTRFVAWLIDFIIVSVAVWSIGSVSYLPAFEGDTENWVRNSGTVQFVATSLVFFAYWTLLESSKGQSIGKMALHIKTTDLAGNTPDVKSVAIQSFGKSFLLVLDVILGWIFSNDKRQRIFSKAGRTIVIKVKDNDDFPAGNVNYRKD